MRDTRVRSLGPECPLQKDVATHSSVLAWRIPWTEEPGELWSMGSQRDRHDWATDTHARLWSSPWSGLQPASWQFSPAFLVLLNLTGNRGCGCPIPCLAYLRVLPQLYRPSGLERMFLLPRYLRPPTRFMFRFIGFHFQDQEIGESKCTQDHVRPLRQVKTYVTPTILDFLVHLWGKDLVYKIKPTRCFV